jgi:hypothetical protein
MGSHGSGVSASVTKRKSKSERAAWRKVAVSPTQTTIEPTPPPPAPDAIPPNNALSPSANGEDETALGRLADDGGPPLPEVQTGETPDVPPLAVPAPTLSLEERVRRLEEALALLQEQRAADTRTLSSPPSARLPEPPPEAKPAPPSVPPAPPPSTAVLVDVGKRLLGAAAQVVPPPQLPTPDIAHPANRSGVLWLVWDTWAEARAIVRMFVDPRYHLPWSARVLPLVVLAAILTSKYWIPGSSIPFLGDWLLVKLIDLLLAFLLFKWLGHEARRYRQTSPDLPSNLRL